MVQAIVAAVKRAETYDAFISDALAATNAVYETGRLPDCTQFAAYLRARTDGEKTVTPRMKALKSHIAKAA